MTMTPPPWIEVPNHQRSGLLIPHRDRPHAEGLLLEVAHEACKLMADLAEVFEVPVVVSSDFAQRLDAVRAAYAERSEVLKAARRPRRQSP